MTKKMKSNDAGARESNLHRTNNSKNDKTLKVNKCFYELENLKAIEDENGQVDPDKFSEYIEQMKTEATELPSENIGLKNYMLNNIDGEIFVDDFECDNECEFMCESVIFDELNKILEIKDKSQLCLISLKENKDVLKFEIIDERSDVMIKGLIEHTSKFSNFDKISNENKEVKKLFLQMHDKKFDNYELVCSFEFPSTDVNLDSNCQYNLELGSIMNLIHKINEEMQNDFKIDLAIKINKSINRLKRPNNSKKSCQSPPMIGMEGLV